MPSKDTSESATNKGAITPPTEGMARDVATLQSFGFKAMSGMGIAWAEAFSEMGSEVLSFVSDRIKEDVKTQHRMLHCTDVGELQKIQTEFVQTAIALYSAESGKLVEMSQELLAPQKDAKADDA